MATGVVCKDGGAADRCDDDHVRVFVREDAIANNLTLSPYDYLKAYKVEFVPQPDGTLKRISSGYQAPPILPGALAWPAPVAVEQLVASDFAQMLYDNCQIYNNLILDIGSRALHMAGPATPLPFGLRSVFQGNWIGNNVIYGQRRDPTAYFEQWFGACFSQNVPLPVTAGAQVRDGDLGGIPLVDLSFPGFYDGSSGNRFVDNVIGRRPDDKLHLWVPESIKAWLALQLQLLDAKVATNASKFKSAKDFAAWKAKQFQALTQQVAEFPVKKLWWDGAPVVKGFEAVGQFPACNVVAVECKSNNPSELPKPCLFYAKQVLAENVKDVYATLSKSDAMGIWLKSATSATGSSKKYTDKQLWEDAKGFLADYASKWGVKPRWSSDLAAGEVTVYEVEVAGPKVSKYYVTLAPATSPIATPITDWSVGFPGVVHSGQLKWLWSWAGELNAKAEIGTGNTSATGLDAWLSAAAAQLINAGSTTPSQMTVENKNLGPWWPESAQQPPASLEAVGFPGGAQSVSILDFVGIPVYPKAAFRGPFDLSSPAVIAKMVNDVFAWASKSE